MKLENNHFSESDLRSAIRLTFHERDDRFLMEPYNRLRLGNSCVGLGCDSSLCYQFELDSLGRNVDKHKTGWYVTIKIRGFVQKIYLGLNDQNATYAEIAESIETFMVIDSEY